MTLEQFTGINAGYILELYERFQADPSSIDPATRQLFQSWQPSEPAAARPVTSAPDLRAVVAATNLASCLRRFGHLGAALDPLGTPPQGDPTLSPESHGITNADLKGLPASLVGGMVAASSTSALEAIEKLRRVYCSSTGFDFSHVFVPEEREWLRRSVESGRFLPSMDPESSEALLDRITQVEVFERFLQKTFPGKTRFSIEGLDMMVPILDEIMMGASGRGTRHMVMGMAHRGRLNVLAHILNKPYNQILAEFKDPIAVQTLRLDLGWMGDVKYHAGASTSVPQGQMYVSMVPNPSHLEFVNPVVAGMARAAGTTTVLPGAPIFNGAATLPVLIHGDAAFPGQGIVAETLNLSRLAGYDTDGTIHIIANNQLGFTATPNESYSTSYASGLARGFKIPIVHVNADDPIACIEAARLAWEYRARFRRDFLIDLVGYRRHGHNEGDEPAFTQPQMYQTIDAHPTVREIFGKTLVEHGLVPESAVVGLEKKHFATLEAAYASLKPEQDYVAPLPEQVPAGVAGLTKTGVPLDQLRAISEGLLAVPPGFTVHKKLERGRERRRTMLANATDRVVDWAAAEEWALATILADGVPIRMTGEDVERGTFSHRHAVLHDAVTGASHVPLQWLPEAKVSFEIHNSPLTESATIGFELGYNLQEPGQLVIWEAQYGDFINGAQVIVDQFVTSSRAKWGLRPSLVFLLPHGYEGQGPEHSSARPERFLQAAADINIRLVNCTTAAQYFHVLRRQAVLLEKDPLPLIVLTPKSLLRHQAVWSTPQELADGMFLPVLDDAEARQRAGGVTRLVLCSGKVSVDLFAHERRAESRNVAIVRVEQLYPFPKKTLAEVIKGYPALREVVWLQEEPENMGAWEFMRPRLDDLLNGSCSLRYIGRARNSSPSEGSLAWHQLNQKTLASLAFDLDADALPPSVVWSKPARSFAAAKQ
jgi:2-oxoglutarate dehydrogenase E1 component